MAIVSTSGTWTVRNNWPWPRMFITDYYLLAIAVDETNLSLYELYGDGSNFNAVKIQTLGTLTDIDGISVTWAERHYIVSAFKFENGLPIINMWGRWARAIPGENAMVSISSDFIPSGTAVLYHKGQLFVGGLKTNNIKWQELGQCAVAYGGVGNVTFDPQVDPMAGFIKLPWDRGGKGKVYQLLSLGNDVIVYGDKGIEKLSPFSNEIIAGYGQESLQSLGIIGFNAAAGSNKLHCFIDNNYNLCLLSDQLKVLGYKNFMTKLNPELVMINYEPGDNYFYISDGTYCFILTPKGLYETHQCPTSIGYIEGILAGFVKEGTDRVIKLETTDLDFKSNGLKTVNSVECNLDYNTSINVDLWGQTFTKYSKQGEFVELPSVLLNDEGTFFPFATGRTFRFKLEGDYVPESLLNISSIKANVNFIDARTRRGFSDTTTGS